MKLPLLTILTTVAMSAFVMAQQAAPESVHETSTLPLSTDPTKINTPDQPAAEAMPIESATNATSDAASDAPSDAAVAAEESKSSVGKVLDYIKKRPIKTALAALAVGTTAFAATTAYSAQQRVHRYKQRIGHLTPDRIESEQPECGYQRKYVLDSKGQKDYITHGDEMGLRTEMFFGPNPPDRMWRWVSRLLVQFVREAPARRRRAYRNAINNGMADHGDAHVSIYKIIFDVDFARMDEPYLYEVKSNDQNISPDTGSSSGEDDPPPYAE